VDAYTPFFRLNTYKGHLPKCMGFPATSPISPASALGGVRFLLMTKTIPSSKEKPTKALPAKIPILKYKLDPAYKTISSRVRRTINVHNGTITFRYVMTLWKAVYLLRGLPWWERLRWLLRTRFL